MEEAHRLHKDTPFGWTRFLKDLFQAQALARPERGYLLGGFSRPDDTYTLIRTALRPRA
jgi:hypothetical protein